MAGRAEEGAFGEAGRKDGVVEIVVEGGILSSVATRASRGKEASSEGVTIAPRAIELARSWAARGAAEVWRRISRSELDVRRGSRVPKCIECWYVGVRPLLWKT